MKKAAQILAVTGAIYIAVFGLSCLIIAIDPTVQFANVKDAVINGSLVFTVMLTFCFFVYSPSKIQRKR